MDGKYFVAGSGIFVIGLMETVAIATGVDGAYLAGCVGAISGIVGVAFGLKISTLAKKED